MLTRLSAYTHGVVLNKAEEEKMSSSASQKEGFLNAKWNCVDNPPSEIVNAFTFLHTISSMLKCGSEALIAPHVQSQSCFGMQTHRSC